MSVTLPVLLTPAEVAKALKVSMKTVQREVADGRFACTMVRKSMRFTEQQFQAYIESQRVDAEDNPSMKAETKPKVESRLPERRGGPGNAKLEAVRKAREILTKGRKPHGE